MGIDQNNMAFPDRSRMLLALAAVSSVTATNPAYTAYHNNYRQLHNATLFSYDATVAASAQSWANSMSPNGAGCSTHSSGTGYGENLAWTSSSTPTADVSYLDSVQSWYSEVKDWSFSTSAGTSSAATGHFTQVVWASSTKVGCGRTQGSGGTCTVCQYDPPGNYVGDYAAQVNDCDTTVAFKCGTTKACIPTAERCNGVDNQCSVGGDIWTGTQYYTTNNDDESGCSSTTTVPTCTSTDGATATSVNCQCNPGTCSSYTCSPGPGNGATCLVGQYCKAASSECSGAANTGSYTPSPTVTGNSACISSASVTLTIAMFGIAQLFGY